MFPEQSTFACQSIGEAYAPSGSSDSAARYFVAAGVQCVTGVIGGV